MKQILKTVFCLVLIALLIAPHNIMRVYASELSLASPGELEDALSSSLKKKLKRGTYFILGIESKLKSSRSELDLLKDNIDEIEEKIGDTAEEVKTLEAQLANIDNLVVKNREKIKVARLQIASYENAVDVLKSDVARGKKVLDETADSLNRTLVAYYLQTNTFFEAKDNSPSLLAFLADPGKTSDVLQENEYLFILQGLGEELAKKIITQGELIEEQQEQLGLKTERLVALRRLLINEQKNLTALQESKQRLLEETQGKQAIYESLLDLSRKEIEQVSIQIARLEENYDFFQAKLNDIKNNPELFENLSESDEDDFASFTGEAALSWPVSPSLGLSAYFHDGAYKRALGVEHNAVDIRIGQGSKVHAAADGIVTKASDNGFGYSYIMIAHPDKVVTLYGHMSEILVKEGEVVRQGQTIGLSGGIPGTKGAGWLTTGAHLHFEVFKNFKHVDPLEYLPLEYVPVSSLPEEFVKKLTGAQ